MKSMDDDDAAFVYPAHDHDYVTPRLAVGSGINFLSEAQALRAEGVTRAVNRYDRRGWRASRQDAW